MASRSISDRVIIGILIFFTVNALVFNLLTLSGVLTRGGEGGLAGTVGFYNQFDPLYADPPLWLSFSLTWGTVVHGPYFLAALYAFWRRREWIRNLTFLYTGAAMFEVIQYSAVEFIEPEPGTNLLMVTLFNLPWAVFPIWMAIRAWRSPMFTGSAQAG